MNENVLLKEILDSFLEDLKQDNDFPKELISQIESLRKNGKIAKGTNLKTILEQIGNELPNEN